jgi:GNAT superfamily N-acetyltransferase
MLQLQHCNSEDPDFRALVRLLDQELAQRDGPEHAFYAQFNKIDLLRHCIVARMDGQAIGCGALRAYVENTVEIKRMYTVPEWRGRGHAGAILQELERWAAELGFVRCILETGMKQSEAIRLYEKSGYVRIPNYGQYVGVENSVCMEKWV